MNDSLVNKIHRLPFKTEKGGLHSRLADATFVEKATLSELEHRLVILPDLSGSMDGDGGEGYRKIDLLRIALTSFVEGLDTSNTACGIESFPSGLHEDIKTDKALLWCAAQTVRTIGDTPMGKAMSKARETERTRLIIISDGLATDGDRSLNEAHEFAKLKVPCDCVHIGDSTSGELHLKKIAKITGGLYIKFDNVQNFAKAFAFLLPQRRSSLLLPGAQALIGAKEVLGG